VTPDLGRVTFLVVSIDAGSGVERTVLTLAAELAATHDVRIVSLYRRRRTPHFPVDPRVEVGYLLDARRGSTEVEAVEEPSAYDAGARVLTAQTDALLLAWLRAAEPGVLVTTRPALHAVVAAAAPPHLLTVAQEHLSFPARMQVARMPRLMESVVSGLDALVSLTAADAEDYRARFPTASALLTSVPNASPLPRAATVPPLEAPVVVSIGRLEHRKGMHRVVDAFAPLADRHPAWRLDIHGTGPERDRLREQIGGLGLDGRVSLRGQTHDVAGVLDAASVFAMGSLHEGFPMVLLEAFSRGVPVVAYDCPRGPAEIIRDGVNGRLVPDGDQDAFTAALDELVADPARRRALGTQALADVEAYSPAAVAARWTALFAELAERRSR
jgi:glycosyltransferase involved in cell wall biosynthesis